MSLLKESVQILSVEVIFKYLHYETVKKLLINSRKKDILFILHQTKAESVPVSCVETGESNPYHIL